MQECIELVFGASPTYDRVPGVPTCSESEIRDLLVNEAALMSSLVARFKFVPAPYDTEKKVLNEDFRLRAITDRLNTNREAIGKILDAKQSPTARMAVPIYVDLEMVQKRFMEMLGTVKKITQTTTPTEGIYGLHLTSDPQNLVLALDSVTVLPREDSMKQKVDGLLNTIGLEKDKLHKRFHFRLVEFFQSVDALAHSVNNLLLIPEQPILRYFREYYARTVLYMIAEFESKFPSKSRNAIYASAVFYRQSARRYASRTLGPFIQAALKKK